MKISVIIPNYNQEKHLAKTLASLKQQLYPKNWIVDLIVVDNESEDKSCEVAKKAGAKVILNNISKSPYVSRNMAVKISASDILAFLDAKSIPQNNWLETGVLKLEKHASKIIVGKFDVMLSSKPELEEIAYSLMYLDNDFSNKKLGTFPAQNFFIHKSLFENIGPFNKIRSGSDNEWFQRARKKGVEIIYDENILVSYKAKNKIEFYCSIKRFGSGARKNWRANKGIFKTSIIAISYFVPMSVRLFMKKIKYRKIKAQPRTKIRIWLVIWKARAVFALSMLGLR